MNAMIECPVCEHSFPIDRATQPLRLTCPKCRQLFDCDSANIHAAPDSRLAAHPLLPDPVFESPTADSRSTTSDPTDLKSPIAATAEGLDPSAANGSSELKPAVRSREKSSVGFICFLAITLLLIIGLGYAVFQNLQNEFSAGKQTSLTNCWEPDPTADSALDAATDPEDAPATTHNDTTDSQESPVPANAFTPPTDSEPVATVTKLTKPSRSNFTRKQINSSWNTIRPRLLSLTVEDQRGRHRATGMIVDSRGWLLTSFDAVANASRIEVTAVSDTGSDEAMFSDTAPPR